MAISTGIVPTGGLVALAKLTAAAGADVAYVAYGTGTTTAAYSDTRLVAEVDRVAATVTRVSGFLRLVTEFTITEDDMIPKEVGVFDAAFGGSLIYRGVIGSGCRRTIDIGETYEVTVDLKPAQGSW